MGEVELQPNNGLVIIRAALHFYGKAANDLLSHQIATDISQQWNRPGGIVVIKRKTYQVIFEIEGFYSAFLLPETIIENTDPRNNYFRVEEYAHGNISFVDGLGSNTGYFKLENLLNHSTTGAHEFGHTLGLDHPKVLDIRGQGSPGIMYPRGTLVDPEFQYDPTVPAGTIGGTLNPFTRKVNPDDIETLKLNTLRFNRHGRAQLGEFTSIWHEAQIS